MRLSKCLLHVRLYAWLQASCRLQVLYLHTARARALTPCSLQAMAILRHKLRNDTADQEIFGSGWVQQARKSQRRMATSSSSASENGLVSCPALCSKDAWLHYPTSEPD